MLNDSNIKKIKRKIIILGEGGVGKTTLLHRYVNKVFVDSTKMTIGTDFFIKKVDITLDNADKYQMTLLLWDFAGQERFRFILNEYIQGAEGIILAFDLSRVATLYRIKNWIGLLKEGGVWGDSKTKFFLLGTKKDLVTEDPSIISSDQIDEFKEKFNADSYFETSSQNGFGVEEFFNYLAKSLI
ncbi:Rab family GTPase [Promethearchaeum syntrophicum]|uniref:Rab family GTPase n=1 Tax=Promethearchaeum syntrophicum TaxID=2594042 RepID=A0A5B9D7X7_9ARCH|nr:Rab family GTPase [Candidatus Prometheoarchaeum syntrophicum]QEE15338.1 Ras family protein [Candidatus Prometheoarchaeum syntrophicum]